MTQTIRQTSNHKEQDVLLAQLDPEKRGKSTQGTIAIAL